ncbi:MAG: CCA tRNA nucleotidyltransferase, partial [Candidatus Omnitrophica bacterium]|nr:CCA tRNA nucleotidyltransferase [Candidatus Omnitrophota bacterium]
MPLLSDYPQLKTIHDIAKQKKVSVYLVGGFLRDFLLGTQKKDLDFAVEKNALDVALAFSKKIKGAYVLLDEARGCARVAKKIKGALYTFDFADFRDKTFEGDLARRDFTINTLSVDLSKVKAKTELADALMDVKRGIKDITDKRIKRVSVRAFKEDPLRMMRAFSLKAILGFKIELKTLNQIRKEKDLICNVSYERIREELFKILEVDQSSPIIKSMDRAGLLEKIIPQVKIMFDCKQGTYHHLDVWP